MKPNPRIQLLQQTSRRLRQLSQSVDGRFQSNAERDREAAAKRKVGTVGVVGGLGLYGVGKAAASKIGSIDAEGIGRIRARMKKFPMPGRRLLSGGALAQALKKMR